MTDERSPESPGCPARSASTSRDLPVIDGERYRATVPDTLDLAERASLAIHGIGGSIDPELLTMWGVIYYAVKRPHLAHWASAETLCDPKFGESLPLLRIMSGSDEFADLEETYREAMLSRIGDGLYWDRYTPERPWRNSYAEFLYGKGKDEDFATPIGTGRMLRAMLVWREMGWRPDDMEEKLRELTAGLRRIAISKDDYCYYPEKGGWGEACAYPRSGWLNTDEATGETEGGEGSVLCMHGHQIYGAAHWYATSGDPVALDLAARLTRYAMKPKFWGGVPDPQGDRQGLVGQVAPYQPDPVYTAGSEQGHWFSHFHARATALRGILEFAVVAADARAAEFVRRAYEFTQTQGIARTGWINCYPDALNLCEACALGDLVALGIRLSDLGLGDYWDDVDAVVRNQLAEQQLMRADLLERAAENAGDRGESEKEGFPGERFYAEDIFERTLGVFGSTGAPTSIPNVWVMHCCTGNATQGLYYAWEGILRERGQTAEVNLLLNRAGRLVDVDSYLPFEGKVCIRNKKAQRVSLRIPAWVSRGDLRADVSGVARPDRWIRNTLLFDDLKPGDVITVTFPISESEASYTVNARSATETVYNCTFRGSTLVDISPRDESPTSYPLYLRDGLRKDTAPAKTVERFVANQVISDW